LRPPSPRLLNLARRVLEAQEAHEPPGWKAFQDLLGPEQVSLRDDSAPLVSADPGRRAGKTTTFLGKSLRVLRKGGPAGICYFAPSDEQGVDIVWEDIREYNLAYDLGLRERWTERTWSWGTSKLEVLGFNTRKDAERARGRKFRLVWIDEAQLAPDWFAELVKAAIMPTTLDYRGQVYATGTPGPVSEGFFFDACHGPEWSSGHHWTCNENPFFIRQGRDALAEARQMYALSEDSITYKREWLGLWIVDPDALVYYIPDEAIIDVPPQNWYAHALGLDLGWNDMDALAAVGVEPLRQWSCLRYCEGLSKQNNHQLFNRVRKVGPSYPGIDGKAPTVVYDPAGHATRKTIETFRVDAPDIHWVEADKNEKIQFIEWLNTDLRTGRTFVERGSPMIKESRRLRWKRPGVLASDAGHSDLGDAWLYSWRYARNMIRELPVAKPKVLRDPFEEHMARQEGEKHAHTGYFAGRKRQRGG